MEHSGQNPPAGQAESDSTIPWSPNLPAATIITVTFIAYAATLSLGFVFDDHVLIVTNDSIRSWRYFPSYFTSHIWSFRYPHLLANYYRPFFLIWLRLNDMIFGLHAWGWHLTSLVAHVAVTYLVYRLALRLTRQRWTAMMAGLIFGLHPIHAEAVADITSIQEPLSTFFHLGALLTFCRSRESRHGRRWLAASLAFTAAALLSKESGMITPVMIAGYAWVYGAPSGGELLGSRCWRGVWPRARSALALSLPYWIVLLAYVPLRIRALKGFAHVITPVSLSQEIFTVPSVLLFYVRLLLWPFGLSCYYDTPYISTPGWHDFFLPALMVGLVVAALAVWWWLTRRSTPWEARAIAFAAFLMVISLLPVLNFRFLPYGEIAHDRYLYLCSVGFAVLSAIFLGQCMAGWGRGSRTPGAAAEAPFRVFQQNRGSVLFVLLLALGMGFATARQSLFWSDDLTLNFRAHQIAPRNVYATTSLAAAVAQQGMVIPAMTLYRQALAVQPQFWRANVNLGYLFYGRGNYPEAARYFGRAAASDPTDGDQFLYLGMSLLAMGRLPEAETAIRTALAVRPGGKSYHLGLGMVLIQQKKWPEAEAELTAELAVDPQNGQAKALQGEVTRHLEAQPDRSRAVNGGSTKFK